MDGSLALLTLIVATIAIGFPVYVLIRLGQLGRETQELRDEVHRLQSRREQATPVVSPPPPEPVVTPIAPPPPAAAPQPVSASTPPPQPVSGAVPPPLPKPVVTPIAPPAPKPAVAAALPESAVAPAAAVPPPPPSRPAAPSVDWETVLGANWLSKLGIAALAVGTAFFLKYAIDSGWIGPTARIAIGLAGSIVLLGLGQFLLPKPIYRAYAQVLSAGGIIIYFLSIYAAYNFYQLINATTGLSLLAVGAIAASALAVSNGTQAVAALCLGGAFLTPVLIREPHLGSDLRTGPSPLVVEVFALLFLLGAYYQGTVNLRQSKPDDETAAPFGLVLLVLGSLAFAGASIWALGATVLLGLPALVAAGAVLALLLCLLALALPTLARPDASTQAALRGLAIGALVLLVAGATFFGPVTARAQAPFAFAFVLVTYLIFLGLALHMARDEEGEAVGAVLLFANAFTHLVVVLHVLGEVKLWGLDAAYLWLPLLGGLTLPCLWGVGEGRRDFRSALVLLSVGFPVVALAAAAMAGHTSQTAALVFGAEFLLFSLLTLALRREAAQAAVAGDAVLAIGGAFVFFGLLAAELGLASREGFVLLCGCALVLAAYHAVIGAWVLRRSDDQPLRQLLYLGLALTFVTIALPLQLRTSALTVAWAAESAVLIWTARAGREPRFRTYGLGLLLLTVGKSLALDLQIPLVDPTPFLNPRFLAGASVMAACFISAHVLNQEREQSAGDAKQLPLGTALIGAFFLFLFVSVELWQTGAAWPLPGRDSVQHVALTVYWTVFALVLLAASLRFGSYPVRLIGLALVFLTLGKVLTCDLMLGPSPFHFLLNTRLLAGLSAVVVAAGAGWMLSRPREGASPEEAALPVALTALASLYGLIFLSVDLWQYVGQRVSGTMQDSAQQLSLSILWALYALVGLSVGIWRRRKPVRLFATGLLYVSIVKVFIFDLSYLPQPHRIISFIVLGLILLLVSLLYTRFEERLR